MNGIQLGSRRVGDGAPVLVIAEAGINHNGEMKLAEELVDAAADAGADVIKFQTHFPDDEMLKAGFSAGYIGESFYDLLDRTKLSREAHAVLKRRAESKGLIFMSTPFSREAADFLDSLGVAGFKTGSGELTNLPLQTHIARKRRPTIISTGMSKLEEIAETVEAVKAIHDDFILMHCTSTYPTPYENVNLNCIPEMRRRFGRPIGLSDHSIGIYTALASVALGACAIEKHFTLDRNLPGPDQKASLEPEEMRQLTEGVRAIQQALGAEKRIWPGEEPVKAMARESVVSLAAIPAGTRISADMVWVKRPGTGIPAKDLSRVVGRRTRRAIAADALIAWDDLEEA